MNIRTHGVQAKMNISPGTVIASLNSEAQSPNPNTEIPKAEKQTHGHELQLDPLPHVPLRLTPQDTV
jgi:hypothetical protein